MKSVETIIEGYQEKLEVNKEDYVTTFLLKAGHIEDPDQSVNWNKKFVEENNQQYTLEMKQYRNARYEKQDAFESELIEAFASEDGLTVEEAKIVFAYAYRESHSSGYNDVMMTASEVADVIHKIKELTTP